MRKLADILLYSGGVIFSKVDVETFTNDFESH